MLPFCGYNMGDYFAHWLKIGQHKGAKLPKIFYANWFRKNDKDEFIWPGFGDNIRVLKWALERVDGKAKAIETPIGYIPAEGALDISGLDLDAATLKQLSEVDNAAWRAELPGIREYFAQFGDRLPSGLSAEVDALEKRLNS